MYYITTKEIASRLNVTARTIRRMQVANQLPQPIRLGHRTIRWNWDEIVEFLRQKRLTELEEKRLKNELPRKPRKRKRRW